MPEWHIQLLTYIYISSNYYEISIVFFYIIYSTFWVKLDASIFSIVLVMQPYKIAAPSRYELMGSMLKSADWRSVLASSGIIDSWSFPSFLYLICSKTHSLITYSMLWGTTVAGDPGTKSRTTMSRIVCATNAAEGRRTGFIFQQSHTMGKI